MCDAQCYLLRTLARFERLEYGNTSCRALEDLGATDENPTVILQVFVLFSPIPFAFLFPLSLLLYDVVVTQIRRVA